jgi:hypothetical protein
MVVSVAVGSGVAVDVAAASGRNSSRRAIPTVQAVSHMQASAQGVMVLRISKETSLWSASLLRFAGR